MKRSIHAQRALRVSVFYDVSDWAFHNVARNIKAVARDPYVVKHYGHADWFGVPGKADEILAQSDLAVFLWRFDMLAFLDCLSDVGWRRLTGTHRCAFIALVYDHIYSEVGDLDTLGNPFVVADCVAASSARLCRSYSAAEHLPDIEHCVPDGVDLELFTAQEVATHDPSKPLRIGWVGNSAWGATLGHDFKGTQRVFEPALDHLRRSGAQFTVHIADKAEGQLPHEDMPGFYRNIDVLVCCSMFEGTPNPVLEAMASGCAVVSTDVGIVRDVFGPKQMQFLMKGSSAEELAARLEQLFREPETLTALKQENVQRRSTLGWSTRWPAWQALFEEAQTNVVARQSTGQALAAFRSRRKSRIERVRLFVANNRFAYRTYSLLLAKSPRLIRWSKRVLSGGKH